ncbi:MAG: FtsK/SpoIIIE domain-containing protein [Prevotella sp.]|nr:FtsK/SpoIIIE domain-containing protein [Prevotella sp.]
MDGTIHRTKKQNVKRPFPWGDIVIWASGIAALLMLFRLGGIVSDFMYGVAGIYIYCVFIITATFGICLRTGKRIHIDPQYLWGAIIMVLAFFTAMHVGFTQALVGGGKSADLSSYLSYCFSGAHLTPGGVLFALPSYLLLVISGTIGTYLLLGVLFLAGLVLVVNRVIIKNREKRIITMETKPEAVTDPNDFAATTAELYAKLQATNKEVMRENRRDFEASKSLLGLGSMPKRETAKVIADSPVPLNNLTTPEAINQASATAVSNAPAGLRMYNDGVAIPWQGLDSAVWSGLPPTVPPTPPASLMSPTPTMGAPAYPYMPSPSMPLPSNMVPPQRVTPVSPITPAQPTAPVNTWEQASGMQWQGANTSWTPPSNPSGQSNPALGRRRNAAAIQNLNNQTSLSLDPPATANEPTGDTFKNKRYYRPTLDLIHTQSMDLSQFNAEASEKETKLNELFQQYNVRARVHSFSVAPAVTRFEIVPELGTRVAQIENLRDDMNFVLKTNNTRMESPIEGKNAIGIEVPNHTIGTVSIKDLLGSREFLSHKSPLAICVGKNISDEPIIADLAEMPHLLVAGTTGSGKSVCINTILTSLIFKTSPEDLKLMLIDMKGGVELGMYNGLPHMLVERCISNVTHAVNAFKWLIREMDHRYDLLQGQHVNNIALYQALPAYKSGQIPAMPYIVMVVDETADLMSRNKKEVEDCIQNLAQKARAAGIHIILATQRPSVDVISGVIKANIGTRIAFRVLSGVDSRTILDAVGAETLMGRGDMLFMTAKGIERVQGCYMTNDEIHRVTNFVREKNPPDFNREIEDLILNGIPDGSMTSFDDDGGGVSEQDPKLVAILRYAVRENNVRRTLSISEIQRKFSVGFGRAGRIMDQLEHAGFVGADFGNGKAREVIATREQVAELYGL